MGPPPGEQRVTGAVVSQRQLTLLDRCGRDELMVTLTTTEAICSSGNSINQ